jgi:DNA-binding protein H-NS
MSQYEDLIKQRNLLDQQIREIQEKERTEAIDTIKKLIESHNLKSEDLFSKKSSTSGKKVPAKYLNPQTGETWTGRGKAPEWIAGKERDAFLIK